MAITTESGLITALGGARPVYFNKTGTTMEAIGVLHTHWYASGFPGAATAPSAGMSGTTCDGTTKAGAIPYVNAAGGNQKYLGGAHAMFSGAGSGYLVLIDRLWEQSGISVTTTTAQTVNSVTWPARDINGSTNGDGVFIALEVSTATTNASAITNMTLSYTNSAGTSGRTATVSALMPGGGFPATAQVGTLCIFQLQAGDVGVRSVQSITLGTSLVTGTVGLIAFRYLAEFPLMTANIGISLNWADLGMTKLYDGTCMQLCTLAGSTTATSPVGLIKMIEG